MDLFIVFCYGAKVLGRQKPTEREVYKTATLYDITSSDDNESETFERNEVKKLWKKQERQKEFYNRTCGNNRKGKEKKDCFRYCVIKRKEEKEI